MSSAKEIKPWTEKHVAEAKAALYRLAADAAARGATSLSLTWAGRAIYGTDTAREADFLRALHPAADFARILRTVRARAEGREVIEVSTKLFVRFVDVYPDEETDDEEYARARCVEYPGAYLVRFTLKRTRFLRKAPTS